MAKELTESRRTRYTRRAMQDALIDLMRERPLGSITIKALCEQADVNRSTFYAHYDSIEELLHDIEDETMAWVTTALDQLLMQPDAAGVEHVIEHICRYIADNRNHLQVLMSPTADLDFQQQLLGLIYSRRSVAEQMQPASSDPAEAQMRMRFAVSGSIGLLHYWLATDLAARNRRPHHLHHGYARRPVRQTIPASAHPESYGQSAAAALDESEMLVTRNRRGMTYSSHRHRSFA